MAHKGLELTADHVKEIKAALLAGQPVPNRGLNITQDAKYDGYYRKMTPEEVTAHEADLDPTSLAARKNPGGSDNP